MMTEPRSDSEFLVMRVLRRSSRIEKATCHGVSNGLRRGECGSSLTVRALLLLVVHNPGETSLLDGGVDSSVHLVEECLAVQIS